jgi:predicted dehydrogenase
MNAPTQNHLKSIGWGVIGAANIATARMLPAINLAPHARLAAFASRDASKAEQFGKQFGAAKVYTSYDDLLNDDQVEVIYIPLPNQLHFEWSLRALEAGKHVLCEKPLCLSADHVSRLCAARDKSGKHIEEGFAFRNHAQWDTVQEIIKGGAVGGIGEVRAAHCTLAKQFLDPSDVRNQPGAGGGALYDLGSYAISACNLIFKRAPQRVVASLNMDPNFGIDRLSSALLDYGDRHAAFTVGTQAGSDAWGTHQQLSILGSKGWMRLNFGFAHARPTACQIELGDNTSVGAFPSKVFNFEPADHYVLQVERFSKLLLGEKVPSWPIEDALNTIRTLEALFSSAKLGQWKDLA